MDIKLQVALISGLVGSLVGVLVTMWQVRKQFEASAELQRRENRIPVMQKLWAQLQPLSFHGKTQIDRSDMLSKISDNLTDWYYKTGGLYLSKTSADFYVDFQNSLQSLMMAHDQGREVRLNQLTHAEFHRLQLEASALRSLTVRDCGTRIETDSKYGSDAKNNIRIKIEKCKECNPVNKG